MRFTKLASLAAVVSFALMSLSCNKSALPQSEEFLILSGDYPDPTILKDGDDYYMTHSQFDYERGFMIWHSKDLLNWTPLCNTNVTFAGSVWAPDLIKHDNKYYIYYPARGTNFVIWADDIKGPWHGPVDLKVDGIDPGHIVDQTTGKRYLFFSHKHMAPLSDDGLSLIGEKREVYEMWPIPEEWDVECDCIEAPKLFYHDGSYHLLTAQGGTAGPATSHMVVEQRAKNLEGPWELSPYNPVIHTDSAAEEWWSTGHGTAVEGPDGQLWMYYHGYKANKHYIGRSTLARPVEWTEDGWLKVAENRYDAPKLSNFNLDLSDNFDADSLSMQWMGWKERLDGHYTLNDGKITVNGKGASPSDGRLLLVHSYGESYEVEVNIELNENSHGGLVLFYAENAYTGITYDGENIYIHRDGVETETRPNIYGVGCKIKLVNYRGMLDMYFNNHVVAQGLNAAELNHNRLGNFLSLCPALVAIGDTPTQFVDFSYKSL